MTASRILVVEDDRALAQMLALDFEDADFDVDCVFTCRDARARIQAGQFDLILLDQQLPDGRGTDLIATVQDQDPDLPIVMMTGQHDLELAIEAIQLGVADFVHKPIKSHELQEIVLRLLRTRAQAGQAKPSPGARAGEARGLIGKSDAMLAVSKEIALCARSSATVLISGESGTGKEVVARLIHQHSGRSGPFIAVNCAAIVETLLESELFGHEKGAFTGAQTRKLGRLEQANEGTLFLDEVGELAPALQAKLLRALQERVFERVGGTEPIHTNARVVAATNRDLLAEARAGRFREDLVYRLAVIQIRLPPLRERREDIPLLAAGLLQRVGERIGQGILRISAEGLERLLDYDWPGNVRELENLLTQAAVHARHGLITPELLDIATGAIGGGRESDVGPVPVVSRESGTSLRTLDEVESEHIQRVLDHTAGHKGRTCEILGISRPALDRKIAKYGLRLPGR